MKTFNLCSLVLLLMAFVSCTKSSSSLDQTQQVSKTVVKPNTLNADVNPGMVVNFNPSPGQVNQPVTVTGTFDGSTLVPGCGKLQLFQKIDGTWSKVADVDVSATVHEVSYQFTPTLVGNDVYEFYLHYIASGNCSGFSENKSSSYFLDVESACQGLSLVGHVASAVSNGDGTYAFTVEYTVNTCTVQYDYLKLQGGLTAFSTQVVGTTEDADLREAGSSAHPNTIVKWEETTQLPDHTKTYSVTFNKAWNGTSPVELTGQWSLHATLNGADMGTAYFAPITYQ